MAYHGIPTLLAERLCRSALAAQTDNTEMALAASLDHHFKFTPQFSRKNTPVMLVGPPGVGKTMAIAKMAASATMAGRKVHVVTTDKSRAGAVEQLKSFTNILELKLWVADDPNSLARILSSEPLQDGSHVLIDTGGISCYEDSELAQIAELIIAGKAEAVAVLAAGSDSAEMSDTAAKFASIGAKRLVITRLDTTRRYGGIFTAADKANLSFSYASVSPSVARGLHMLNPVNLARLLLRDPTQQGVRNEFDKAEK
jgi:flagellar biosynthesis protein FlhF